MAVVMFPLLKNSKKSAFWGEYDKGYYGTLTRNLEINLCCINNNILKLIFLILALSNIVWIALIANNLN